MTGRSVKIWSRNPLRALLLATMLGAGLGGASAQDGAFLIVAGPQSAVFVDAISTAVQKKTDAPKPIVQVNSTAGGAEAFCRGHGPQYPSVLLASRALTAGEIERCAQAGVTEILEGQLGFFAQVLIQKRSDPPLKLSTFNIYSAFAAETPRGDGLELNKVSTWKDVNGGLPQNPIKLFLTSSALGSRLVFDAEAMADGCREVKTIKLIFRAEYRTRKCITLRKDVVVEEDNTEKRLAAIKSAPPGAIGLVSYDVYLKNKDWAALVDINGATPSPESVAKEEYTMTTPLYVIAKKPTKEAVIIRQRLFDWMTQALSEQAIGSDGYLSALGLMALPSAQREAQRRSLTNMAKK